MADSWYRGKVVLITGASGGIGRATARLAAAQGARLVLVSRSERSLSELASGLPGGPDSALVAVADVGEQDQMRRATALALERFGRVDVAIANAGIEYLGPVETLTAEEFEIMVRTNFLGVVYLAQALLPAMKQQGAGTFAYVSSPMARLAFAWASGYAATKAAGEAFALGLRHELAESAIRVVTIYPGPTTTDSPTHLPASRIPAWHTTNIPVDVTAAQLLAAVARGRATAVLARSVRTLMVMQRLVPGLADRIIAGIRATKE